jgi:hypothetical protein
MDMEYFIKDDPRGEYWIYIEDSLNVRVGRGGISGVCHFNTSDIHLEAGGPLSIDKAAQILVQLMVEFGGPQSNYRKILLHRDGKYDFTGKQIALIDQKLSEFGFGMLNGPDGKEILWSRKT